LTDIPPDPNHRRNIDYPTMTTSDHMGHRIFRTKESSSKINVYHSIPVFGFHTEQQAIFRDPCIVYQNIDSTPLICDLLYYSLGLQIVGNITLYCYRFRSCRPDGFRNIISRIAI
jgi:hypothetical protein